jgi:hypothetical protein
MLHGLLAFIALGNADAQSISVDFQVIHSFGIRGSVVNYLAVRSQEDWNKFWQTGSLEPTLGGGPSPTTTAATEG